LREKPATANSSPSSPTNESESDCDMDIDVDPISPRAMALDGYSEPQTPKRSNSKSGRNIEAPPIAIPPHLQPFYEAHRNGRPPPLGPSFLQTPQLPPDQSPHRTPVYPQRRPRMLSFRPSQRKSLDDHGPANTRLNPPSPLCSSLPSPPPLPSHRFHPDAADARGVLSSSKSPVIAKPVASEQPVHGQSPTPSSSAFNATLSDSASREDSDRTPGHEHEWKRQRMSSSSLEAQYLSGCPTPPAAMGSRLSLEDRVIRRDLIASPSSVSQRRTRQGDELDGLAALSTAAFLRLDESM
jgi:hypothetical protein